MRFLSLNKALLWKEWRQNRWLFIAAIILMSLDTIVPFFLFWIFRPLEWLVLGHPYNPAEWSWPIAGTILFQRGPLFSLGLIIAVVLGVALLILERSYGTLEYLVSTPVSRKDIVKAKYFTGAAVIAGTLIANYLFMIIAAALLPSLYSAADPAFWFVLTTAGLIAAFSMSFLVATFTGNLWSAAIGVLLALFGPRMLVVIFYSFLNAFGLLSWTGRGTMFLSNLADHLSIFHCVGMEGIPSRPEWWNIPLLIAVSFGFYKLAVFLFERNALEKNGRVLMFGKFMSILKVAGPLILAMMAVTGNTGAGQPAKSYLVAIFFGVLIISYLALLLIQKIQRTLGLKL